MTQIKQKLPLFVVFLAGFWLFVDLFQPWQEVDGDQISGWHGIGIAVLILIALILVARVAQARHWGRKIPVPPAILILLPSLLVLILVVIKFFVVSDGRQTAAWVGLALAVILFGAAVFNALPLIKMGIQMRKMMKAHNAGLAAAAAPEPAKAVAKKPAPAEALTAGASCDGDWAVTMETPMGVQEMTLTLLSVDGELTGKADTPFGVQEFDGGVVKGDNIAWEIDVTTPMPMTLTFKASIIGDKLGGTAEVAGMGESPFEGTRVTS